MNGCLGGAPRRISPGTAHIIRGPGCVGPGAELPAAQRWIRGDRSTRIRTDEKFHTPRRRGPRGRPRPPLAPSPRRELIPSPAGCGFDQRLTPLTSQLVVVSVDPPLCHVFKSGGSVIPSGLLVDQGTPLLKGCGLIAHSIAEGLNCFSVAIVPATCGLLPSTFPMSSDR